MWNIGSCNEERDIAGGNTYAFKTRHYLVSDAFLRPYTDGVATIQLE